MTDFFLATKNPAKIREFTRMCEPLGLHILSERDLKKPLTDVEETGTTFEENALLKAEAGAKETGLPTVADDSGLCVDALDGAPGIFSARFAGSHGDDAANRKKLLDLLKEVPEEKRTAYYECAMACVFPDGRNFTVRGFCKGKIAFDERGTNGFGYDSVFLSEIGRLSEVSNEEKDAVSHRGEALAAFLKKVKEYL